MMSVVISTSIYSWCKQLLKNTIGMHVGFQYNNEHGELKNLTQGKMESIKTKKCVMVVYNSHL